MFSKKNIIIAILVLAAVLGGGFLVYEYYLVPKGADSLSVIFQENKNIFFAKDPSKLGPRGMYLRIKAEVDATKNFDELLIVIKKYGDKLQTDLFGQQKEEIARMSEAQKSSFFAMAKATAPALKDIDAKNIKEIIQGNKATLQVFSSVFNKTGEVIFVKESGIWKIQQEFWK